MLYPYMLCIYIYIYPYMLSIYIYMCVVKYIYICVCM